MHALRAANARPARRPLRVSGAPGSRAASGRPQAWLRDWSFLTLVTVHGCRVLEHPGSKAGRYDTGNPVKFEFQVKDTSFCSISIS